MGKPSANSAGSGGNSKIDEVEDANEGGWRVVLLRALVAGNLELVSRTLLEHIDVISMPFTALMPAWKLQWESMHWWLLQDATPLFVASAYSHAHLVQWLLIHGADRYSKCYLGKLAVDFVGECCEASFLFPKDSQLDASEKCRQLLLQDPQQPAPPSVNVNLLCHVSSEVVVVKAATATPTASQRRGPATTAATAAIVAPTKLQQTIYKCLVDITWETPISNGAIIDKYEVRYRILAQEEGEDKSTVVEREDADGDGDGDGEGDTEVVAPPPTTSARRPPTASSSVGSWRLERTNHNRKSMQQGMVLEGLQFDTMYEFMLRSWNAAGKGEWGKSHKLKTVTSPENTLQQQQH